MPDPTPVVSAGVVVADHLCTPIDHLPAAGELVKADELVLNIGGGACNAAMDLARLGVRSTMCGRVGDDIFGRFVAETLRGQGVDCRGLRLDHERATSQTLIVNVKGQDRRFIHSFGANEGFTIGDLDTVLDPPPRVLFIGYFLILPHLRGPELASRMARLRQAGTITVVDVACPGPSADYLDRLRPVLRETDVFMPNRDEAALILGETDPVKQALAFHELGAQRVVVTLGEHGAVSVSSALKARLGAYPIEFVDGSGGGDAFDSGYIAGLLEGRDEIGCLELASAVGASCVRAVGTTAGVFTRAEAEAFMSRNRLHIEQF